MKRIGQLIFVGVILLSCDGDTPKPTEHFLLLKTNSYFAVVGGAPLEFKLAESDKPYRSRDVTAKADFFLDGVKLPEPRLVPTKAGYHQLTARYRDWVANPIPLRIEEMKSPDSISIPIIFQVLQPPGQTFLTGEEAAEIIDQLNKGFENELAEPHPNRPPSGIYFRLARLDNQNRPMTEPGINRQLINGNSLIEAATVANRISWNPNLYLNLFVDLQNTGQKSYGVYPLSWEGKNDCVSSQQINPSADWWAVYEADSTFHYGAIMRSLATHTIMHEIGHVFGLTHVHEGCGDCAPWDVQFYAETNKVVQNGMELGFKWCHTQLPVIHDNCMDYNARITGFTAGQIQEMRTNLASRPWLSNLNKSPR